MDALVNPRTGVVRRLTRFRGEAGDAPLVVAGADVADPGPLGGADEIHASGAAGFTWEEAARAAVGEACERYAAAIVPRERVRVARARDLPGEVARGWALFTDEQHAHPRMHYAPWAEDRLLGWTRAVALRDGREAWVPAQFVWLPYLPGAGEGVLAPALSTGLAAGPDAATATLAGLLEVVERDAFTLAWLARARPPRVPDAALPARAARLARHARTVVLDLTHDLGIPTYVAVVEQPTTVGVVRVVGAAARPDPAAAMEKAVVEAFQTVPYVRDLVRAEPAWRAGASFENLRDFRDHARIYTVHPEYREGLAFLLDGPFDEAPTRAAVLAEDAAAGVRAVVARLAARGLDAYAVDVTTRDVADAGLRVVRALVPQAQPLHGFYQVPHLAGARWRGVRDALPYPLGVDAPREVNRWPHPFA